MKKLVLTLAVVFSVSLFSCGNKAEEANTEATDAAEETPCCQNDTCKGDSCNKEVCCEEVTETVAAE